jgi:hypothetical protein
MDQSRAHSAPIKIVKVKTGARTSLAVRRSDRPGESATVKGTECSFDGVGGFAVHKSPPFLGNDVIFWPWKVSHIETGARLSSGDTRQEALENAAKIVASMPKFKAQLAKAVAKAKREIAREVSK